MDNNISHTLVNTEEIPVTQVHMADSDNPPGTECWIIESHRRAEINYWGGYFFYPELNNAVRLCRKEDALTVRRNFSSGKDFRVVKHVWL